MFDSKLTISVITGAVATAAAFRKDLNSLFGSQRSLQSQIKTEEERIAEVDKVLRELNGVGANCAAAHQALETDRTVALGRLKRLTEEFSRQREDPNYDLSFIQRMLLLFRPDSGRAEIIHWGAWVFLAVGLISILSFINHQNAASTNQEHSPGPVQAQPAKGAPQKPDDTSDNTLEYLADLVLLSCLGFLVLRGWALSERRGVYGYDCNGGVIKTAFLLKRPANLQMLAAQTCFWACVYYIVESVEDFLQDLLLKGAVQGVPALLKFLVPFAAAFFCKQWAASELKYAKTSLPRRRFSALFLPGFGTLVLALCFFALAGSYAFVKLYPNFFDEKFHSIGFILESGFWAIACSQWFALASQPLVPNATPQRAQTESASSMKNESLA